MTRDVRFWVLAGFTGLAGFGALHAWAPQEGAGNSICVSRRLLHLPCPGCGMTRAFAHLAKGEWSAAVTDHPLAPVLALEAIVGWTVWGAALAAGRPFPWPARLDLLLVGHAAALIALWLGRVATGTLPW